MAELGNLGLDLAAMTTGELIEAFVLVKSKLEAQDAKHRARTQPAREGLGEIQAQILANMNADNSDSFKVDGFGTAFFKKNRKVSVSDWTPLYDHMRDEIVKGVPPADVLGAFQRKITVEWVVDYEIRNKQLPPGVNMAVERELQIRRINTSQGEA